MVSWTHLFQYGSNMSPDRLADQVQRYARVYAPAGVPLEIRALGPAELPGWRFAVDLYSAGNRCRVSNIVREEGASVWGALYVISVELVRRSDGERSVLDRIEGHRTRKNPENYEPLEVRVLIDEAERVAWTYVGLNEARERCANRFRNTRVSDDYRQAVLDGAVAVGLPAVYIADLRRTLWASANDLAT
jgi:hypothetical protein